MFPFALRVKGRCQEKVYGVSKVFLCCDYQNSRGIKSNKKFSTVQIDNANGLSYCHRVGRNPLIYTTFGRLVELTTNKYPERVAFLSKEENVSFTYSQLLQKADALAASLRQVGIERGDKVGILAPNCWLWQVANLAINRAGCVLVALNPAYQKTELEKCSNKVGMKALIALESFGSQEYYRIIRELAQELGKCKPGELVSETLPSLKTVIVLSDKELPGTFNYDSFSNIANPQAVQRISSEQNLVRPDEGSLIQFTSGTTSDPKAILQCHFSVANASLVGGHATELSRGHQKICVQLPFFHAFASTYITGAALVHGATMVLPAIAYNPRKVYEAIQSEACTAVHGTPTMFVDMLAIASEKGSNTPTSLKYATTGGAPVSPQLVASLQTRLKIKKVMIGYGLTETSAVSFITPDEGDGGFIEDRSGAIMDHMEAKVIGADGETVPFGQIGELCMRGYSIMNEYYKDEIKTKEAIGADRWFKTGDQAKLYENGYVKIVGRIKEMIIRGGENIYPTEIEDILNSHDDILESFVFGVPDERLGEDLCVAVRLRDGSNISREQMKSFCTGKLSHFRIPKHLRIVTAFPRTPAGKVQKFKLREMFEKGALQNI